MVKRYIMKIPAPIEAIQYDGSNFSELKDFAGKSICTKDSCIYVHTSEGDITIKSGSYIAKENGNSFHLYSKSEFENTFDELDERQYVCASMLY